MPDLPDLLEAFLDATDEAVFTHDGRARITSWNRSAQRIFGYAFDEIVGRPSGVLVPGHLQAGVGLVFETVGAGDRVDQYETEAVRKDGLPIVVSLSLRPIFDEGRRVTSTLVVARDITEQRLAQATLAEIDRVSREREALAHVGSWLWDVRTGVVQWSDEMHRIHGLDPLDFEGTLEAHVRQVHAEDSERVRAGLQEAAATSRPLEDEYRIVRPGGEARWVLSRAEPGIGSGGEVVGLSGISQDVTDRRPVGPEAGPEVSPRPPPAR